MPDTKTPEPKVATCQIPILPPVLVINRPDGTTDSWTFERMVDWIVDGAPRFNNTRPGRRQGNRICDAIETGRDGFSAPMLLEDAKALLAELDSPVAGYIPPLNDANGKPAILPGIGKRCMAVVDAVDTAIKFAEAGGTVDELPVNAPANGVGAQPSATS